MLVRYLPDMRSSHIVTLCILTSCSSGCSLIVAGQTREIAEAMYEGASHERIEAMTGPPVFEQKFSPPYPATQKYDRPVGFASSKAEYVYHGRADDVIEFQGLGMLVG